MPHTPDLHIIRAWRYTSQPDRVHFVVTTHDGDERKLSVSNESGLGQVLDAALLAQGYVLPASADASDEQE